MSLEKFDYSQIIPGYYDQVYQRGRGVQSRWHHKKFEAVRSLMPSSGTHLDVGCGPGTFIGSLTNHQLRSLGIDIAQDQTTYANSHYKSSNKHFKSLSLLDHSLEKPPQYDVVTFIEVLEHLPREEALELLSLAHQLLKPRGCIIVTTPNYHSAWPIIEQVVNYLGEVSYAHQHINRYSTKSLFADLANSGFVEIKVSSFMSFSPFLASLSWPLSKSLSRIDHYTNIFRPAGMLLIAKATRQDNC